MVLQGTAGAAAARHLRRRAATAGQPDRRAGVHPLRPARRPLAPEGRHGGAARRRLDRTRRASIGRPPCWTTAATTEAPVVDPRGPGGRPGTRAPHLVVRVGRSPGVHPRLFGRGFVLLAGPGGQAWCDAAERVSADLAVPLAAHRVARRRLPRRPRTGIPGRSTAPATRAPSSSARTASSPGARPPRATRRRTSTGRCAGCCSASYSSEASGGSRRQPSRPGPEAGHHPADDDGGAERAAVVGDERVVALHPVPAVDRAAHPLDHQEVRPRRGTAPGRRPRPGPRRARSPGGPAAGHRSGRSATSRAR